MIVKNKLYILSSNGILKTLTLLFGASALTSAWYAYSHSKWTEIFQDLKTDSHTLNSTTVGSYYNRCPVDLPELLLEQVSLMLISTFILISTIDLISFMLIVFKETFKIVNIVDLVAHVIGSLTQFITAGLIFSSVRHIEQFENCMKEINVLEGGKNIQAFELKIAAGTMCIFNGIIYGTIAGIIRSTFITEQQILEAHQIAICKPTKIRISKSENDQILINIKQLMKNKK